MEILQDWKLKYQILESKYKELLSDHKNLQKNHEEMLKGKREDLVQIENLKAENEALKKQVNVDTLTEQPNIKISDFAKTIFSRMPEMIKTLSIFSQRIEVVETEPEIRSSVRMSGKPPQARPDHGIQFECTDPGIYEAFFIIGASKTSNIPSILFEYPFENSSIATAAKRVLPEFCFPSSIEVKELNNRCSSSELNKILYGQSPHRSRSTYVFTIRSEELLDEFNTWKGIPNSTREELYILVERVTDVEIDQESQLVMPKCYCIASYIPIFELHYEIIANLQVLKRLQRMEEFMSTGSLTVIEKLSDEQIGLLESYSNCDSIYPGLALNISCEKMDDIRYTVPENLSNLDIPWLCSPLFSVLSLNDLLFVIFALTQEKSLIFVSENLGLLTSSVLGSLALLRPLKWPNINVPIVPDSLYELLDAPVPMIAGINSVPSDSRIDSSIGIFVFLDQNEKINRKKIDSFYEPKMHELRELLREPYSRFTDNKSLFKVNAEKKQACIEIFQIFYTFWNKVITCWNEGYEQDEWNQILGNNHNISDIKYLESFTMTQMFTNHVQEDYF